MSCWICGSTKISGEHIPKATSLKSIFGKVTSTSPLFLNNESSRNKHIQSIDSKYLKHRQICTNCNNSVTQKHDEMWDIFFNYLQENKQKLVVG
ncbi:hypothetical protein MCERE10_03826 [Burkholderiaceae bacterium]